MSTQPPDLRFARQFSNSSTTLLSPIQTSHQTIDLNVFFQAFAIALAVLTLIVGYIQLRKSLHVSVPLESTSTRLELGISQGRGMLFPNDIEYG